MEAGDNFDFLKSKTGVNCYCLFKTDKYWTALVQKWWLLTILIKSK